MTGCCSMLMALVSMIIVVRFSWPLFTFRFSCFAVEASSLDGDLVTQGAAGAADLMKLKD